MKIEQLGCGLTEIKLINTAHVINDKGDTIFKYNLLKDEQGNNTKEVLQNNNATYTIYNRTDGARFTIYLAANNKNYLGVYIKYEVVSFTKLKEGATTDFILEKLALSSI